MLSKIAGDKFEVKSFTNLKTESHGFEPSAKEIAELSSSKIMFINGAGMEDWEDAVKKTVDIDLVNTSEGINLIKATTTMAMKILITILMKIMTTTMTKEKPTTITTANLIHILGLIL